MKTFLEENLEKLHKEYAEKEQKIKDAIKKEKALNISSEVIKIATILHDKLCHSNHADACDWFYDDGDWGAYSRKRYIEKAKKMLHENNIIRYNIYQFILFFLNKQEHIIERIYNIQF